MDPDQAHRQFVKAAYDAKKTAAKANKQRKMLHRAESKLGEQYVYSFVNFNRFN